MAAASGDARTRWSGVQVWGGERRGKEGGAKHERCGSCLTSSRLALSFDHQPLFQLTAPPLRLSRLHQEPCSCFHFWYDASQDGHAVVDADSVSALLRWRVKSVGASAVWVGKGSGVRHAACGGLAAIVRPHLVLRSLYVHIWVGIALAPVLWAYATLDHSACAPHRSVSGHK